MSDRRRMLALPFLALAVFLAGCSDYHHDNVISYVHIYQAARETAPPAACHGRLARAAPADDAGESHGRDGRATEPVPLLTDLGAQPVATAPADGAPAGGKPAHWSKRRGPAYEDDWLRSFGRDAKELPATMWADTKYAFTDPWTLVALGAAGAAGVATHKSMDDRVADHYKRTGSDLPKFWDDVGDIGGNPGLHFAVAGAMYFGSLHNGDTKTYETSKALLNALAINGLLTVGLKAAVDTESPNDEPRGWPSGHTSSTFCFATVMHEAYGPWVGVPLFAFAAFVGYERLDARNHDFSDVISGAIIGIAIGHAVMQNHVPRVFGFDVIPYINPDGGSGIALTKRF